MVTKKKQNTQKLDCLPEIQDPLEIRDNIQDGRKFLRLKT